MHTQVKFESFFLFFIINNEITHCDIGKSCSNHEVVDPGLKLKDAGWRVDHPNGGQHKEEDGRKERQESFVQTAVLQSVTPITPEKPQEENKQHCI